MDSFATLYICIVDSMVILCSWQWSLR